MCRARGPTQYPAVTHTAIAATGFEPSERVTQLAQLLEHRQVQNLTATMRSQPSIRCPHKGLMTLRCTNSRFAMRLSDSQTYVSTWARVVAHTLNADAYAAPPS